MGERGIWPSAGELLEWSCAGIGDNLAMVKKIRRAEQLAVDAISDGRNNDDPVVVFQQALSVCKTAAPDEIHNALLENDRRRASA
jgi:hypothetical protein